MVEQGALAPDVETTTKHPGSPMSDLTVIVLAAGGGTRMKSKTMKVLHPIAGHSMIGHVLAAVSAVSPARVVAVVEGQGPVDYRQVSYVQR